MAADANRGGVTDLEMQVRSLVVAEKGEQPGHFFVGREGIIHQCDCLLVDQGRTRERLRPLISQIPQRVSRDWSTPGDSAHPHSSPALTRRRRAAFNWRKGKERKRRARTRRQRARRWGRWYLSWKPRLLGSRRPACRPGLSRPTRVTGRRRRTRRGSADKPRERARRLPRQPPVRHRGSVASSTPSTGRRSPGTTGRSCG